MKKFVEVIQTSHKVYLKYIVLICSFLSISQAYAATYIGIGDFSYKILSDDIYPGVVSLYRYKSQSNENFGECSIPSFVQYSGKNYRVISIEDDAFRDCTGLTSITIPSSVISIGRCAFYGCTGLTSVTIPESVTSIGKCAFERCTGLTSVTIPESVTSIGEYAFQGCTGLTSVTIPESVTSIGEYAFQGCTGLTSVTIPESVTSIGEYAFQGCTGLTSVTIPESVTYIGYGAYSDCSELLSVIINSNTISSRTYTANQSLSSVFGSQVKEYTLGDKVTSIGRCAFYGCTGLTSVTIPESVTSIGKCAFECCTGLTSVTIPESVTSIGEYAFQGCTGLTSVTIPESVTSIGKCAFYGCTGLTSVTIPESVTSIGKYAFQGCTGLTSVTIPESVTSFGEYAFQGCTGLTSVTIPESVTSIGEYAFQGCTGLTSVTIPESVTSIGEYAFQGCTGLTSVTIPESVTSIGSSAFLGCTSLTLVTLDNNTITSNSYNSSSTLSNIFGSQVSEYVFGENVHYIGTYACYNCNNLSTIVVPKSVTSIGEDAFYSCPNLVSVKLNSNAIVSSSWKHMRDIFGSQVKEYILGDDVKCISRYAFYLCVNLESINIPDSVTSIEEYAFSNCKNLEYVEIGRSVMSIGSDIFLDCPNLKKVRSNIEFPNPVNERAFWYIPSSLETNHENSDVILSVPYGTKALYQNLEGWKYLTNVLTEIQLGDIITLKFEQADSQIKMRAVVEDDSLNYVRIGTGDSLAILTENVNSLIIPAEICDDEYTFRIVELADNAFKGMEKLKRISIPSTVSQIRNAFNGCTELDTIIVDWRNPEKVEVYEDCFADIPNDAILFVPAGTPERYACLPIWSRFSQILEKSPVSLEDIRVRHGYQKQLPISLKSKDYIAGMQMKLSLPSGISLAENDDESNLVVVPNAVGVSIFANRSPDNEADYLIVAYDEDGKKLNEENGRIMNVLLNIDENVPIGKYEIHLNDINLATSAFETLIPASSYSILTVIDYTPGDVNDDGSINIGDVAGEVNFIMEADTVSLRFDAADLNEDCRIRVDDLTDLLTLVLDETQEYGIRAFLPQYSRMRSSVEDSSILNTTWDEECISLAFQNENTQFVGLQFDLRLPDGVRLKNVMADRMLNVEYKQREDGSVRVIAYSMSNHFLDTKDILQLCLDTKNSVMLEGQVAHVYNIILTNKYAQTEHVGDMDVFIEPNETSIRGINEEMKCVNSIYDLNGRKIQSIHEKSKVHLDKGVYIKKGYKVIVK